MPVTLRRDRALAAPALWAEAAASRLGALSDSWRQELSARSWLPDQHESFAAEPVTVIFATTRRRAP
ncbi:MAG: hypothetical protein LBV30_00890 [Propionibacteriaceae bacterium]|nr:hypothetical protein [Propionibacteriaceae bacterium]